jgi:hypothetical protein
MIKKELERFFAIMSAGWDQRKLTSDQVEIWSMFLADLDGPLALRALADLVNTQIHPPAIAEIKARCALLQSPGLTKTGDMAWGEVLAAISQHGYTWKNVHFDDPITDQVVKSLGWLNLCASENMVSDRAQFIAAYEKHRVEAKAETQRSPGALPQYNDRQLAAPLTETRAEIGFRPTDTVEPKRAGMLISELLGKLGDEAKMSGGAK